MIKKFLARLSSLFQGGLKNLYHVLVPIVQSSLGKLIDQALPIAIGIVSQIALDHALPSADKRTAAVSQLKAALIQQGLATSTEITTSILNMIVELALTHLKVTSPSR